jgi:cyclic pyranopterin phosphate synthase
MNMELTHFNNQGRAQMVDVTEKGETSRQAAAAGYIKMHPDTLARIRDGQIKKGDVLAVAQVAGIMSAKRTWELIPMCHPLLLTGVDISFEINEPKNRVEIRAIVKTTGKTGVEMEALTAVSAAALTVYDMCKAIDRDMIIGDIRLVHKSGGRSGLFERKDEQDAR